MKTRRVKRALNKIGQLMISNGIKEDSELWRSFWDFHRKFTNHYKSQMRHSRRKRMQFKGGNNKNGQT